jgi:hypothetical protein
MTRSPTLRIGLAISLLALPGCATIITPQRCQEALTGLHEAAQITQALIDRGVAPAKAQKLADALAAGQLALEAVCAEVEAAHPPAPPH